VGALDRLRRALGLAVRSGAWAEGELEGTKVRVRASAQVEVQAEVESGLPPELRIEFDPRGEALDRSSRSIVAALRNSRVRRASAGLLRVAIHGPTVEATWDSTGPSIPIAVRETVRLARRLRLSDADWSRRLRENVEHDPQPYVRRVSLAVLLADFPGSEDAGLAIRGCLKALDPELRLLAAKAAGGEGLTSLFELAHSNDDMISRAAVDSLTELCSKDQLREIATQAIGESSDPPAQRLGLRLLAVAPVPSAAARVRELARAALAESTAELAILALVALDREVPAEPALIDIAKTRAFEHLVFLRALEAIGEVGGPASMELLSGVVEGAREPGRSAARAAQAKIAARLAETGTGRLSLSQEGQEGRLSAPDASGGGLAVAGLELDGKPKV
jgi:hypothetical protein